MVMRLIKSLWLFALCLSSAVQAEQFIANVDRNKISENETFSLVLRYEAQVGIGSPNTDALQKDFNIINQQRSQQFRSINGKTESFTQWIVALTPKKTGQLTIPALSFKGKQSSPIQIEVVPLSEEIKKQTAEEFFFDISVEPKTNAYVQKQIVYTEKLYYGQNHTDATLSEFKVTDARVQQLGDIRTFNTVINGKQFGVYERRFAIFPETTGELVIPGQRFSAQVSNPYDRWSRGRPVSIVNKPITLNVLPIPTNYPSQAAWLPARKLILEERFSSDPSAWKAGEAVTRTFILKAEGIPGSQLPEIKLPVVDGLRYYPDQIRHEEGHNEQGVTGVAEQAIALVASRPGQLVLPEVRIPWWNTESNKLEYAILPSHRIEVKGSTAVTQPLPAEMPAPQVVTTQPTLETIALAPSSSASTWLQNLMAALLALSLIANAVLLYLWLRRPANTTLKASGAPLAASVSHCWKAFNSACTQNNAEHMRSTLLAWVNAGGLELATPINSLHALAAALDNPRLKAALAELDAHLYSANSNHSFNGNHLKELLQRAAKPTHTNHASESLYPAA